ncbi:MAG: aminotransferase class V-fold PLP-dependent enzyme [Paludibacter sp.]
MIDVNAIRNDFPLLQQKIYNRQLVYFDNAATTQKPQTVIDTTNEYYQKYNSNIHRGVHSLSEKMTESYENARRTVKSFINAQHQHEIIFTSGTTEAVNLVAFSFGEKFIKKDDEIILSQLEHHSNIVPWQLMCERTGAKIKVIPATYTGDLDLSAYERLFSEKTKIVSVNHVSNSLGTINDIEKIIQIAHCHNVPVFIDGAQGIHHQPVDVQKLDCDFYAFSGHKIYGPTGIGVLYGKEKWLNEMPPYKGGGDMIKTVTFEKTTYNDLPFKFEAGTTNFIGAIGLSAAIKYIEKIGRQNIFEYEDMLLKYATEKIKTIPDIRIYGTSENKISVISFLVGKIHHFDTGMMLDKMDIAVRTGNHCTQPIMKFYGIEGTVRASLSFYNTTSEIDYLVESLLKIKQLFA